MSQLPPGTPTGTDRSLIPRPPRHPAERPMQKRTAENDTKALKIVALALEATAKKRTKSADKRRGTDGSNTRDSDAQESARHEQQVQDDMHATPRAEIPEVSCGDAAVMEQEEAVRRPIFGPMSEFMLPLTSMFEGTGEWPRKKDPVAGVYHYSWSNIGYPCDESLVVSEFEEDTHIDVDSPWVAQLSRDIPDIKTRYSREIADDGVVDYQCRHNRVIETFILHGRTVAKVKMEDADVFGPGSPYSRCGVSKELERKLDEEVGTQPALEVEQWVAAHLLLARAGQIGGRTEDYWRRARDMARQQLYTSKALEGKVRKQMQGESPDAVFDDMIGMVRKGLMKKTFNPYTQSERDEYAVKHGLLHFVEADIVMVLDKANHVIAFQFSDAFGELLTKNVENKVTASLDTFSTLQPVPVLDMTRHGLRWVDWLAEHPELDFRISENDPRRAKSRVYHFGGHCETGDPNGKKCPIPTKDSTVRTMHGQSQVLPQLHKLRFSAFGACTELTRFFFSLLDPELLRQYTRVAAEVGKLGFVPFETRRQGDPFVIRALLVNLMTNEHRDLSDWQRGFAALVPVGDFEGGDLVLRELGLQIRSPPGCVQLIRGRELRHSITRWKGRRFVVVNATHDAVRRWALRRMGEDVSEIPTPSASGDNCMVELEDYRQEDQVILSERERIPERYVGVDEDGEDLSEPEEESETSMPSEPGHLKLGVVRRRHASSSDASGEQSESDGRVIAAKRQKLSNKRYSVPTKGHVIEALRDYLSTGTKAYTRGHRL
ncbi:hypothetical protein DL771_003732 [Monosporascus sp. 5C6A]|nr:hypothetical protein DL771_003732 [Monosporascus sp. 5C6A]